MRDFGWNHARTQTTHLRQIGRRENRVTKPHAFEDQAPKKDEPAEAKPKKKMAASKSKESRARKKETS
jgi:hypothetical protein